MTNGNEPTEAGATAPNDDQTSIVQRPDIPATGASSESPDSGAGNADATTISQLPATPAPQADAPASAPADAAGAQKTEFIQTPVQPAADGAGPAGTAPYTQAGAPSDATTVHQPPQFGQTPAQPQYNPAAAQQPGQPQFGAPAQPQPGQPQYGQPQYGQPQPGQAPQPQYGAPAYGPGGQPQFSAPGQPQPGQPQQFGAPAYGPAGQPQFAAPGQPQPGQAQPGPAQAGQPQFGGDPTLNPYAPAPETGGKSGGGKGKLIAIIGGVVVLIAAIVLITAFVWPKWAQGGLNQDSVQSGVQKILTDPQPDGYGISDVKDVSCPDGQKVEAGTTFTCSVTVNGDNKHVTVTVKDSDGTYEVSRPTN